ncbi:hypothetical protein CN639_12655 [Bacillus toyonensis]|uniref:DUF2691 domain-containing protein n=2 Tax=Bacillus toyonensis TaxID=155322 RepID=A0AAP8F1Y8_9BACI|nr:DUF2691 family protein [Bacillus toyonensis]PEC10666.1 hypothetical protein CON55_11965 [Bacillus toyonensis]PEJ62545.1 hypothetical protein CN906_19205 [Bacillus toyonensis]PEM89210.1 hypothetical protein CN639_12655 [Bacillus toyonensis]PEN68824.1 hypothetical protein CN545_16865 [Bacillus toyonensis]PEN84124.1 hypothetical protein CN551_28430 [Bacillus toyonensis]
MNIGIHFHAPEDENFFLSVLSLLEPFNFKNYSWQVNASEIYLKDSCGNFTSETLLDDDHFISGNKLEQNLRNKNYFLIFLTICAFPELGKNTPTRILTAIDFINTDCEFVLSIVDGFDISILCKDEELLTTLYQHVQDLGYVDTKYLTVNNSGTF